VKLGVSKEQFVKALRGEGIPASPIYTRPLYDEPIFRDKVGRGRGFPFEYLEREGHEVVYKQGSCPNAERVCKSAVGVYLSPAYTLRELDLIVKAIRKVAKAYASMSSK